VQVLVGFVVGKFILVLISFVAIVAIIAVKFVNAIAVK
jgi:hypothetical protein